MAHSPDFLPDEMPTPCPYKRMISCEIPGYHEDEDSDDSDDSGTSLLQEQIDEQVVYSASASLAVLPAHDAPDDDDDGSDISVDEFVDSDGDFGSDEDEEEAGVDEDDEFDGLEWAGFDPFSPLRTITGGAVPPNASRDASGPISKNACLSCFRHYGDDDTLDDSAQSGPPNAETSWFKLADSQGQSAHGKDDKKRELGPVPPNIKASSIRDILQPRNEPKSDEERYKAAGITPDKVQACCENFDSKIWGIVEYLVEYAKSAPFEGEPGKDALMVLSIRARLQASRFEKLSQLFQSVVPTITKAILGNPSLRQEQLLLLPPVHLGNQSKGIYMDYITDVDPNANGLYIGSTTKGLAARVRNHIENMKFSKRQACHYGHVRQGDARTPNFRCLAIVPEEMPQIGVPRSDAGWLIRVLEGIFMILLDTLAAGSRCELNITESLHQTLRSKYGLQPMRLHRLNHAFSTKQGIKDSRIPTCGNCKRERRDIDGKSWTFDRSASDVATVYLCMACC